MSFDCQKPGRQFIVRIFQLFLLKATHVALIESGHLEVGILCTAAPALEREKVMFGVAVFVVILFFQVQDNLPEVC